MTTLENPHCEATAWKIVHIPEKPLGFFQESTVDVIASHVEPKLANILVRKLCQVVPLENLRHVKRVRRRTFEGKHELSIILCPTFGDGNQLEGIPDDVQKLINDYQLCPFTAKVAKFAASSREEWEDQCKLWPTSYHPMVNVDDVANFTPENAQWSVRFMKTALNLATPRQLSKQVVNAAVIVDPSTWQIIASAIDQTVELTSTSNIMDASSCLKDTEVISFSEPDENDVEYHQTLFRLYNSDECTRSCYGGSCLYPWRWLEQKHNIKNATVNHGNKYLWHPLRHAALVAVENAATRDRQLFPNPALMEKDLDSSSGLQDSSINIPTKKQKTQRTETEETLVQDDSKGCCPEVMRPYLCTGFDIYLVWEPCTMCAMALVHQRIRRIFYAFPNPNAGALGSIHRLQGEKSLNHHYSVYRIFPSTEEGSSIHVSPN